MLKSEIIFKKILLLFILFLPILIRAQVHIGFTEAEIKKLHSDKTFETGFTDYGAKYTASFMHYGTFFYWFDKQNRRSIFCTQVIEHIPYLNAQVEVYNKKYVILSDTEWKAYLEDGEILNIRLKYDESIKKYVFYYTLKQ